MAYSFEDCKPVLAMMSLQFIYATMALALKVIFAQGMSTKVFIVYRHATATLSLAPTAYLNHKRNRVQGSLGKKSFGLIFLAALIGVTVNQNFYNLGMHLGSPSLATAMTNLIPATTFLIAAIVGLEKVNIRSPRSMAKVLGTAVCVGGALFMTLFKGEDRMMACLLLLASCCCWSIWLILQVPLCDALPDPSILSFWMCICATFQSAILALFLERDPRSWALNTKMKFFSCFYVGIAGSAVTYLVQAWCISKRGPLFSAMFNPLCTVITTILAFFFLDEQLYIGSLMGAFAVVIGLYVVLWGKGGDPTKTKRERSPSDCDSEIAVVVDDNDVKEPLLLDCKSLVVEGKDMKI